MGKEILKAKKKSHMEERTFNLLASLMEYPPRSMVSPDSWLVQPNPPGSGVN